jgi:beta-glucosidase-like glycosyl hydrolase
VARKAATESIVLLKNAGDLLPLDLSKIHSLVCHRAQRRGGQDRWRRQFAGNPKIFSYSAERYSGSSR